MRLPREDDRFSWTHHVVGKMLYYAISEGRIRRIIRAPKRVEEGIAPETVAVMQPAGTTRYQEIWVMYKVEKQPRHLKGSGLRSRREDSALATRTSEPQASERAKRGAKPKIKVITAWRYPGKAPERDPVPKAVIEEVRRLL